MGQSNKQIKTDGAEGSLYWNWVNEHSGSLADGHTAREFSDANPDVLSEEDVLIKKSALSETDEEKLTLYYRLIDKGMLKKLSPRQREIWKLRFFKWLSPEEIGKKLGMSVPAVHTHINRAAAKIKIEITKKLNKKNMLDGHYFKTGFKKGTQTKGETSTDAEFGERLLKHKKEIDNFCEQHPELNNEI